MSDKDHIRLLGQEAWIAGDLEQAALCRLALAGDVAARIECERVIEEAIHRKYRDE